MKKVLLLMLVLVVLFAFVACGGESIEEEDTAVNAEVNDEITEEQVRIDKNNAVILPKLDELEAVIVEIEKVVADNDLGDQYQSAIDQLREEFDVVTQNHQEIIEMGGYLEGTADFEAAVVEAIEIDKEILDLLLGDLEISGNENVLIDKFNELADLVNEVTLNAQENGWDENEELLSELGVIYGFLDEVKAKIDSSENIDDTYKNETVSKIDQVLPVFQNYLKVVSEPFTE